MGFLLSDVDSRPVLLDQASQGHQTLRRPGRVLGDAGAHRCGGGMAVVGSFSAEGGPFGVANVRRQKVWWTNRNGVYDCGRLHGGSPVLAQCNMGKGRSSEYVGRGEPSQV